MLLIDEVDRVEVETEALLLEILSDYQVSIPELGTIEAKQIPLVFLTSNNTRELSEALKRRCLFLHIDYPDMEREKEIVLTKVPDITESLADQVARIVRSIRQLELKKSPSVSETLDWARTLLLLGVEHVDAETAKATINILLKYQSDIAKAVQGARPSEHGSSPDGCGPASSDAMTDVASRAAATPARPMLELLDRLHPELREAGLPVSLTENLDAMEAVKHIPLEDREAFKYALAATLVKNNTHWRAFETVFEVYFSLRGSPVPPRRGRRGRAGQAARGARAAGPDARATAPAAGGGGGETMTPEEIAEMLYKALQRGDDALMRALARQAVTRFAGMEPGRPVGGTYYLYRTLRNLDLDGVLDRLMQQARDDSPEPLTPLEERLEQDEYQSPHRPAEEGDRGRDPPRAWSPTAGSRPWPRPCASRCPRTSTSCTPPARRWRHCARRSTRSPASSRCAWPASVATAARARSTSAAPSATR